MSGPITVTFTIYPAVASAAMVTGASVLLAHRALVEARAMQREYGEVLEQLRMREAELARMREAQQAARLERVAAMKSEVARHTARIERLRALAGMLEATAPDVATALAAPSVTPPAEDDDAAWSAYLRELEAAAQALEAALEQAADASGERARATLTATIQAPTLDDVLSAYVLQRQMQAGLDPGQAEHFRQTAARVLGRLQSTGSALPVELQSLARAIVLAPSVARAETLASELRLAVQRENEARAAQLTDAAEAQAILAELPEDAPQALRLAIERVAAGVERIDAGLRRSAQDVLDAAAADRLAREQEAAAYVLEQSLRDLGYEVEDVEATLFGDGGTVHFRRPGWENYFVRLRVDPRESTANFNVVRARGDEETPERRRLDALAEDRWCAEFPRLMETLAARGLGLDVRRRLEAGEVPVQVVDGASLPRVHADEDAAHRPAKPLARRNS